MMNHPVMCVLMVPIAIFAVWHHAHFIKWFLAEFEKEFGDQPKP